jgi:cytochrome c biogenesis protein CcmG/thiol:disulfide interchange protein DsbE
MNGLFRRAGSALLLLAAGLALGGASPRVGEPAPDFQLTLIDGSHVQLSELRGQVVVLNFWATWCVPCRRELPLLDGYYRARQPAGLRVFAVTTEGSLPVARLRRLFDAMAVPAVRSVRGPYGCSPGCRPIS